MLALKLGQKVEKLQVITSNSVTFDKDKEV